VTRICWIYLWQRPSLARICWIYLWQRPSLATASPAILDLYYGMTHRLSVSPATEFRSLHIAPVFWVLSWAVPLLRSDPSPLVFVLDCCYLCVWGNNKLNGEDLSLPPNHGGENSWHRKKKVHHCHHAYMCITVCECLLTAWLSDPALQRPAGRDSSAADGAGARHQGLRRHV